MLRNGQIDFVVHLFLEYLSQVPDPVDNIDVIRALLIQNMGINQKPRLFSVFGVNFAPAFGPVHRPFPG